MTVLDASTLILIAKIEALDLFLGGSKLEVAIPAEVEKECCAVKKSLDALMIRKAIAESRIRVFAVKHKRTVAKLRADFALGKGESEAIALALAEKATIVGIDDKNEINACKLLGLEFTTAIGILILIRERRLLPLDATLAKLAALATHGRYKQSIMEDARKRLEATL
jgi:predicted nucleic acid-binding protein